MKGMTVSKIALFFILSVCSASFCAEQDSVVPVATGLKQRQPHWTPQVLETHPNGNPKKIVFYEQLGEASLAVKQVQYYADSHIQVEADLISVTEDSAGYREWKSTLVPHGMTLSFFPNGKVEKIASYDKGVLHGEVKIFYPEGAVRAVCVFNQGKRQGKAFSYYEDGLKAEEGTYDKDLLVGEVVRYHPKEVRAAAIPHVNGLPHGNALEWYESGALKSSKHYMNGKLHSDGKNPALVLYNEERSIEEVQDFKQGEPIGVHIKYHPNGKEKYRVPYKNGKREGKEQFFTQEGKCQGEGLYKEDKPVGDHWKNHENGQKAYMAKYDAQGKLKEPIIETNDQGIVTAKYFIKESKRHGEYKEWYPDGKIKVDFHYEDGLFDGPQTEYFASGQMKLQTRCTAGKKEGSYKQWHENGQLEIEALFARDEKMGDLQEWFANGKMRGEEHYNKEGALDRIKKEWYENGTLKLSVELSSGKKQGWHREWNEKGALVFEGFYENDLPKGAVRTWYDKDKLKESVVFVDGKREGKGEEYHPNGKLKAVVHYKNDSFDGQLTAYHEDGSVAFIKNYKLGIPVGDQKEYFSPGQLVGKNKQQLARSYTYNTDGKFHGEQRTYYPNGATQTLIVYKNGVLDGMKALWDQEGNLMEEGWYEQGKLNRKFFEKGRDGREVVYHYKNNKKEGLHEIYYPPHEQYGKVKALQVNFVNDQAEGEAIEYDQTGAKVAVTIYHRGLKEGVAQAFDPKSGKEIMKITFKEDKKQGPALQYFPDGKVFKEAFFANDLREGEEKTYHTNGVLASLAQYCEDKLNGCHKEWNADGILIFEGEYRKGLRHGKLNKYYDDGKPKLIQTFVDDALEGSKRSFDEKGKLISETKYEKGKQAG